MRPGNDVLMQAREAQASVNAQLKKKWTDLSKQLGNFESQYSSFGCRYHYLPTVFRERMVDRELAMACWCAFTAKQTSNTELGYVPDIVRHFDTSRGYRETVQHALYIGDIPIAERDLEFWEELQDDIQTDLEVLSGHVNRLTTEFSDNFCTDNERDAAKAVIMRKTWILALPEVVKAFELGTVENEAEAIAMVIAPNQEEMLAILGPVHALPDVEEELVAEAAAEAAQNNH